MMGSVHKRCQLLLRHLPQIGSFQLKIEPGGPRAIVNIFLFIIIFLFIDIFLCVDIFFLNQFRAQRKAGMTLALLEKFNCTMESFSLIFLLEVCVSNLGL